MNNLEEAKQELKRMFARDKGPLKKYMTDFAIPHKASDTVSGLVDVIFATLHVAQHLQALGKLHYKISTGNMTNVAKSMPAKSYASPVMAKSMPVKSYVSPVKNKMIKKRPIDKDNLDGINNKRVKALLIAYGQATGGSPQVRLRRLLDVFEG